MNNLSLMSVIKVDIIASINNTDIPSFLTWHDQLTDFAFIG